MKKKYGAGGDPTNDAHVAKKASLYQRLLEKSIIDPTIDENTFYALPKEKIDEYFKAYGKAIGAKTQEEVDAMPGTKEYLTPTIFTGAVTEGQETFEQAFARARAAGLTTFDFNGKPYTTELGTNGGGTGSSSSTVTKKEDYVANLVNTQMGLGGSIGQALGAASALIPGIGPIISPILTPILGELGNSIGTEKVNKQYKSTDKTVNPTGNFKEGGKAPDNLKPLEGGYFNKLADGVFVANGNTHKQGGIDGDVDNDGQAEIEFEHGELYFEDGAYIVSAKNSEKFKNSFSKRDDKVGKTTNKLLESLAIRTNEATLKEKNMKMFAGGGGIDDVPKQQYFWSQNETPVTPFNIQEALFTMDAYQGSLTDPVKGTPTATNPAFGQGAAKGLLSGIQVPTATGTTYKEASTATPEKFDLTTGDKLIMAGQAIPAVYNLARGLFEKSEVVSPSVHPYADKIKSIMGNRSYNPQTVQNEIDYATSAGKDAITENTTSASVARSNFQGLYDTMARNKAKADLEGQQMNNQYKADYAGTLDSLGRFEVAANEAADAATWANQVAKDNYVSTGVSQVGSAVNTVGAGLNANATNNMLFNILGEMAQNYTIDKNGKITFKG